METDREVLFWLHERLKNVHKESELYDYMHRFRRIILAYPRKKVSRNGVMNGTDDLVAELKKNDAREGC